MTTRDQLLIVGLGLMGGSYAAGLSRRGYMVSAIDRDETVLQYALGRGWIALGAVDGEPAEELLKAADYVIMALYPGDILPWLQKNKQFLKPGAMLTDLAGVKGCFVPEAQELLGSGHEFIPSHPMAGREKSGIENADDAIFTGANFLITPTEHNTGAGVAFARELAETLGFARITELSVEEHDRMIGYVSQLTHAIAVSLMNANDDPLLPKVTGDSFRDLTRIADINEVLWSELFLANAPALTNEIEEFVTCLEQLKQKLNYGDKEGLQEMFKMSTMRRREFDAE